VRNRWVIVIFLVIIFAAIHYAPTRATFAQSFSSVYLSPVSYNATVGSFFTVNVMLNLAAGQNVSGFDLKLNYSNPQPNPVVRAQNISYSGNIFGDNFVSTECVPFGSGPNNNIGCQTSDPTDSQFGWVHFSALANSGNPVIGPLTGMLFSIKFSVDKTVTGSSLIHINTANLGNTGSGAFATTQFIPASTADAIFSNSGIVAFFNYAPTDTPSVVTGHSVNFDATGSFNANTPSFPINNYTWDFGDGTTNKDATPTIQHTFATPGRYNVNLIVTDSNGGKNSTRRSVVVGPALGALVLTVYSLQKQPQAGVSVQIFNSSVASPFGLQTTDSGGQVTFQNLTPGSYTLSFSGRYVKNSTATETILAGWTTQGSVGIEVDTPAPPDPTPWYGDIVFLAGLAGAVGVFGVGLFFRRRRMKKLRANKTGLKKR